MAVFRILQGGKAVLIKSLLPEQEDEFVRLNPGFVKIDDYPAIEYDDCYKYDSTTRQITIDTDCYLQKKKQDMLENLKHITKQYIEQYYPEIKQRSDVADKEYWGAWLLSHNDTYTSDSIYKQAYQSALNILNGTSDLQTEVSNFPQAEQPAWEQLIKIALRVAFVQQVKEQYRQLKQQIEQATTLRELEGIRIEINVRFYE